MRKFLAAKLAAFLVRLNTRIRGSRLLYEYRITLDYGKGEFGAVWYRSGHPILKPEFEQTLQAVIPDELKEAMIHVAEDLESEAKLIRGMYP